MDFARPHVKENGVVMKSKIRILQEKEDMNPLDRQVLQAANQACVELFGDNQPTDSSCYPERLINSNNTILPNQLVVIFESFDSFKFVYATPKQYFSNRNGHFCHDDFINKPFGCIVRSRNNSGYGYIYILKPTPELWARSLLHRTQIVHELDASFIVMRLNLRPNMIVCESGTGSGAMSHCILRSIAPHGMLHTYEFNQNRAKLAEEEFTKHGCEKLVQVYHHDVCGKGNSRGGFLLPQQSVDAVFLDLPEPWLAIQHAAFVLKSGCRICSYSPCLEQSQKCIESLKVCKFHSIQTFEVRLKEYHVDQVELESPPTTKRPRQDLSFIHGITDKKKSDDDVGEDVDKTESVANNDIDETTTTNNNKPTSTKQMLCARPFNNMRGHTAFLTFATASYSPQPDPNEEETKKVAAAEKKT